MDETYTVKDVARLYKFNINTLYKKIQQGKIKVLYEIQNGKKIQKIKKSDIEVFLGIIQGHDNITIQQNTITIDTIRNTITDIVNTKSNEINKSLEDFALYKLGKIETEYKFLQEKYEDKIQENTILQDKIKALPDKEAYNSIQSENILLKEQALKINKKLQDKEQALKELEIKTQKDKEEINFSAEKEKKELEMRLKQSEEEKAEMEARLKAESEEREKQIVEAWKKELELAKRPWWKKLWNFGILI